MLEQDWTIGRDDRRTEEEPLGIVRGDDGSLDTLQTAQNVGPHGDRALAVLSYLDAKGDAGEAWQFAWELHTWWSTIGGTPAPELRAAVRRVYG
jgi:hypothetical protein